MESLGEITSENPGQKIKEQRDMLCRWIRPEDYPFWVLIGESPSSFSFP